MTSTRDIRRGIRILSRRESSGLTRTNMKNAMTIGRMKSAHAFRMNRKSTTAMNASIFRVCFFKLSCGPGVIARLYPTMAKSGNML